MTESTKGGIQIVLADLELAMQAADLWSNSPPSQQALASQQPFACDTLYFEQWLQFIFIPRMLSMIASEQPLPRDCAILPMAEESLKHKHSVKQVLALIESCDALLSSQQG